MSAMEVRSLTAGYGAVTVVHAVDLDVPEGQVATLIGANGAGKTTLLRTMSGLNRAGSGSVTLAGEDIKNRSPAVIANAGLAHVPENRRIFPEYSVADNLRLGAYVRRGDRAGVNRSLDEAYEMFQVLGERREQTAGTLSGGEQQMLAIAMALAAKPKVLMLDEPSLGLAPLVVRQVYDAIGRLREAGMTILLVEQRAKLALEVADTATVLRLGRVVASGTAAEIGADDLVRDTYLGTTGRSETDAGP